MSRSFWLYVLWLCLVGVLCSGCASRAHNIDRFEWWTRYYETRMGLLDTTTVSIGETTHGACAELALVDGQVVTTYDPDRSNCRPPWDVALHEACHRRLFHHITGRALQAAGYDLEAETRECERWYRDSVVYSGLETQASRLASRTAHTRP